MTYRTIRLSLWVVLALLLPNRPAWSEGNLNPSVSDIAAGRRFLDEIQPIYDKDLTLGLLQRLLFTEVTYSFGAEYVTETGQIQHTRVYLGQQKAGSYLKSFELRWDVQSGK